MSSEAFARMHIRKCVGFAVFVCLEFVSVPQELNSMAMPAVCCELSSRVWLPRQGQRCCGFLLAQAYPAAVAEKCPALQGHKKIQLCICNDFAADGDLLAHKTAITSGHRLV